MPDIPSLVASIDRRLDVLNAEINQLEKVRHAVEKAGRNGSGAETASSPPSHPRTGSRAASKPAPDRSRRPRSTRSRPARRKASALKPDDVVRILSSAESGLSASAIADQAGADYPATLKLLRELELDGQLRREGTRRSTRWRLISDEERIAARTAELERLVRRAS